MAKAATPAKPTTKTAEAKVPATETRATDAEAAVTYDNKAEAKTRFNAALDEAKAGAAALRAEASERSRARTDKLKGDASAYRDQAKTKAGDLAVEGKAKASGALASLGRMVDENAHTVDEYLGAKYGDYARSGARSLDDYSRKLDEKSIDELGEDAREFVRKSPGLAVGIAAVGGFMLARMFGGGRS